MYSGRFEIVTKTHQALLMGSYMYFPVQLEIAMDTYGGTWGRDGRGNMYIINFLNLSTHSLSRAVFIVTIITPDNCHLNVYACI